MKGVAFRNGLLGAVLLVVALSGALATPITYKFEGSVGCSLSELQSEAYVPCGGEFGDTSAIPVPVSGYYIYDSDHVQSIDMSSYDAGSWGYRAVSSGGAYGIHWQIGSLTVDYDSVSLLADHRVSGTEVMDTYRIAGGPNAPATPWIYLQECTGGSLFSEPGMPTNFDLSKWSGQRCQMDRTPVLAYVGPYNFYGRVTSLYRVPEPSSLALVALSLAGLAFARRKR